MPFVPVLVASLALSQSLPPWMTGESRPEDLRVSLVTFSPGDSITEWWGHTALVVEDTRLNHGRLYNYGMFGFADGVGHFLANFMKGRLEFWVADDSIGGTYRLYQYLNRDVRIQELNLTPEQALLISKRLGANVLPENRVYLYHHYNDNCSTRPRDLIDEAFGGQLVAYESQPSKLSLRLLTRRYSMVSPPASLGLDFLQNDELDRPITLREDAFLPDELERHLAALKVKRPDGTEVPAVKTQWNQFKSNRTPPPESPPNFIPGILAVSGLLAAFIALLGHLGRDGQRAPRVMFGVLHVVLGLVFGTFGLVLFLMGALTDQTVTHRNENLFFVSPLTFAALPLGVMLAWGSARAARWLRFIWAALAVTSVVGVLVKVLPAFNQDNWNIIALAMPVNLAMAFVFWLSAHRASQKAART
jgi:hypothetical protein